MRKLARIETIIAVNPIPEADAIELVTVQGWQCVAKKGEFKPGDLGVYFEIDSFLPLISQFEFLKSRGVKKLYDGSEGIRLKTMRFRGALSQGLMLPLNLFPELAGLEVGTDVTEKLGVKLFELPVPASLAGEVLGDFPNFIPRTDQERIQNLPEYFERFKDEMFEVTEKLDGTSCTYYFKDGTFGVCGRNFEYKDSERLIFWNLARKLNLQEQLKTLGRNIALQGEVAGPGIQANPQGIRETDFFLFDVFDIDTHRYWTPEERRAIPLKISHVPVIEELKLFEKYPTLNALLDYANRNSTLNPQALSEGIVCKRLNNPRRVSFKAINNAYLLK